MNMKVIILTALLFAALGRVPWPFVPIILLSVLLSVVFAISFNENHQLLIHVGILSTTFLGRWFSFQIYLNQKKEIKRNNLLNHVPIECIDFAQRSMAMDLGVGIRATLGFTSDDCLKYDEAKFLPISKHNYFETFVYTATQPFYFLPSVFGESLNDFYKSLSKKLMTYECLFIFLCILVVLCVLVSSVVPGMELNIFNIIFFRHTRRPELQQNNSLYQERQLELQQQISFSPLADLPANMIQPAQKQNPVTKALAHVIRKGQKKQQQQKRIAKDPNKQRSQSVKAAPVSSRTRGSTYTTRTDSSSESGTSE